MSENSFKLYDAVRTAAAVARAAYGDMTGVAVEAAVRSKKIIRVIVVLGIAFILFFTVVIASLMELIPGFETIYRLTHPLP